MSKATQQTGTESLVYVIETKSDIFWSRRKMDTQYIHATQFLYKDRAIYKEMNPKQFEALKARTTKELRELT